MAKHIFNIKEVAEILDISPSALRYYDTIELIDIKRNDINSYREYSLSDIYKLHQIIEARELEIPIKEISKLFNHPDEASYLSLAADRVTYLQKEIKRLEKLLASLNSSLGIYSNSLKAIGKLEFITFPARYVKHIGTINEIETYNNIDFIDNMQLFYLDFNLEETLYFCNDSNAEKFDLFLEDEKNYDIIFPASIYCTTAIKGDFYIITNKLNEIINDLEGQGYRVTGPAIQLVLPEHLLFTSKEDALVRLQIPIE